jgi:hypothetical protein
MGGFVTSNADSGGRYRWDWVNNGHVEYSDGMGETKYDESYVVRRPDGRIFCITNRCKTGYERALTIAEAMNATLPPNDSSGTP